jgi:hypothetical protein
MVNLEHQPQYDKLTVAQARAMRAHQARLAASYAYRAAEAVTRGRQAAAARWTTGYRRATARCRLLGERIRGEGLEDARGVPR